MKYTVINLMGSYAMNLRKLTILYGQKNPITKRLEPDGRLSVRRR